ncbi:C-type lectin domain family 4 member D [Elysia marginata]|uniref:C-type lectin domain family 4 member D n=1 Tax=Elysia marginata TaxID=1093978 RepID=A0AAV4IGJ8_9GAST|nr:C-type lectin domain family 4 member D [Elysia marginata]
MITVCPENQIACPRGWSEVVEEELWNPQTCISSFQIELTWDDARRNCRQHGGDLVKIQTKAMNDAIMYLMELSQETPHFIGLRARKMHTGEDSWSWLDEDEMHNGRKIWSWLDEKDSVSSNK